MHFNLLLVFTCNVLLMVTVSVVSHVKVVSKRKDVEQNYWHNYDLRGSLKTLYSVMSDPVCCGNIKQKKFLCQQVLDSLEYTFDEDKIMLNSEWKCERQYLTLENRHTYYFEYLLMCPLRDHPYFSSYYISFARYNFFKNSSLRLFGYFKDRRGYFVLHRYFNDVSLR